MSQEYKKTGRKGAPVDNVASAANEIGNKPPQATDVEEAVIGAMLIDSDCVSDALEVLTEKSFYNPKLRIIFKALVELYKEKTAVDILTATEKLRSEGHLDEVGGVTKLADLTQKVGSAAHIEYYIKILQQKTIQRDLIDAAYGILRDSFDESTNVDNLIKTAEDRVYKAVQGNLKSDYKHIGDVVNRSMERIQSMQGSKGVTGIASGFPSIDQYTRGWQKDNLIILGARPSVGKTAFALNLARNAAVDFNVPTAFFSLEMSDLELADRLIAAESGIDSDKIKGAKNLADYEWTQLENTISRLVKAPLFIDETPGITITEFTSKVKRLHREQNVQLVFVDYLQLMHASNIQSSYREQEVSAISQALKATAKELHIPIVALSQLNRNLANRPGGNGIPVLSDLRDSGSIEQDADLVMFIHRPYMLGMCDDESEAQVIIAKHRNGRTGKIEMRFSGQQTQFIDMVNSLSNYAREYDSRINIPEKKQTTQPRSNNEVPYDPFVDFRSSGFADGTF